MAYDRASSARYVPRLDAILALAVVRASRTAAVRASSTDVPAARSRPEAQAFINEWPCAVLPDEIAAGNIRALINVGGSLVTSFPETAKLVPALSNLELFATTEIINNETTELATHVLPTKDPLERPDITIHDILSSQVSVQYSPAVVDPVVPAPPAVPAVPAVFEAEPPVAVAPVPAPPALPAPPAPPVEAVERTSFGLSLQRT